VSSATRRTEVTDVFGRLLRPSDPNSPLTAVYVVGDSNVYRQIFGGLYQVLDDRELGSGELVPSMVRKSARTGRLLRMDDEISDARMRRIHQWTGTIETADEAALVSGRAPHMFVAAVVEHRLPDDLNFWTTERGLVHDEKFIRSPIVWPFEGEIAALKKYDEISEAWNEEPGMIAARFVASDPHMTTRNMQHELREWLVTAQEREREEAAALLERIGEQDLSREDFAQAFQAAMRSTGGKK
jgi:hypothetical protein